VTIARQLGLEPTTVGNFFMNARRRSHDKWREGPDTGDDLDDLDDMTGLGDTSDPNIKYEVWDDGMDAAYAGGGDAYNAAAMAGAAAGGQMGGHEPVDPTGQAYHMTSIPAPVHNPHNQMQSYPSTCA